MSPSNRKWPLIALLVLVVILSAAATYAVLRLRSEAENPLMPPPVKRTIALREVLVPAGAGEEPGTLTPVSNGVTPATGEAGGESGTAAPGDQEMPVSPEATGEAELLGTVPTRSLAQPFPGVDGPQRVEDARAVTESGRYSRPRWSPLGIDLALVRMPDRELVVQPPVPGATSRFVMRLPQADTPFEWNDDGMTIRVQNLGPNGWVEVLLTGEVYPAQAPASPLIAAAGRIIAVPAFPGEQPLLLSPPGDEFSRPLLSPDGAWAAYQGRESGLHMASLRTGLIWRIGPGVDPVWMPDSSGLMFVRTVEDLTGPVGGDLFLATVDGRYLTNLTRSPGLLEKQPGIAPDGERVAFVRGGLIHVGVYRNHLADPKLLSPDGGQPMGAVSDPDAVPNSDGPASSGESLLR